MPHQWRNLWSYSSESLIRRFKICRTWTARTENRACSARALKTIKRPFLIKALPPTETVYLFTRAILRFYVVQRRFTIIAFCCTSKGFFFQFDPVALKVKLKLNRIFSNPLHFLRHNKTRREKIRNVWETQYLTSFILVGVYALGSHKLAYEGCFPDTLRSHKSDRVTGHFRLKNIRLFLGRRGSSPSHSHGRRTETVAPGSSSAEGIASVDYPWNDEKSIRCRQSGTGLIRLKY